MDLGAIQEAIRDQGLDGWLFFDFHHKDPISYRVLGVDMNTMTTRRWFYLVPANGEPTKLCSTVEPTRLDSLPGKSETYLSWKQLHQQLALILKGRNKIAMQYSPMGNIPYVSNVDAGTIEMVRAAGVEVVTSADLVQTFDALFDAEGFASHREAGETILRIKDDAYAMMDAALRAGKKITEFDVCSFILDEFESNGLTTDGSVPIVGFNDHPADPHFEPTAENAYTLHHGDTILIDLWARRREPAGVYYDVTWCGFAGQDPPDLYREIWDAVVSGRDRGLEFVRSRFEQSKPCFGWEVDDATRAVVRDAGYGDAFVHRTGHSIGVLDVHGNGANIDNLETRDERRLAPGSCFSIEPGIYLAGQMAVRSEIDVFITTEGAVEVFGAIQTDLIHVG
ncbi:MAG: M24 family metallopeptidase [Acidobacteriota bacterium]|nr:M24 family metallopeptidase [Acidobacteriota bacterium]MDH3785991.1 M24 family metallopeptidase [Acidobacteriota bacterium]